jgi:hypothetical protein
MAKQVIKVEKELPEFLPQGWKGEVAKRIGIHPNSMCRILRNKRSPNYMRIVETAKSLYGKPKKEQLRKQD